MGWLAARSPQIDCVTLIGKYAQEMIRVNVPFEKCAVLLKLFIVWLSGVHKAGQALCRLAM